MLDSSLHALPLDDDLFRGPSDALAAPGCLYTGAYGRASALVGDYQIHITGDVDPHAIARCRLGQVVGICRCDWAIDLPGIGGIKGVIGIDDIECSANAS